MIEDATEDFSPEVVWIKWMKDVQLHSFPLTFLDNILYMDILKCQQRRMFKYAVTCTEGLFQNQSVR